MITTTNSLIYALTALVCSVLLSYALTPIIRVLAFKIGAIDVPKDTRRMHKTPTPRIGGLAIFLAFFITSLFFCEMTKETLLVLGGGLLIVILGMFDDVKPLNAWVKLVFQLAVASLAVFGGIRIEHISIGERYISLGVFSIPITIFWITALTNAINIIDGLDGLSCGVSTISSISVLCVLVIQGGEYSSILITLILIGSCFGFLPWNKNPAKIFMGDTGALFLGYTLSVISVEGMFKMHAVISMIVPLIIFALPLADTSFAIVRRLLAGKSPFSADRGHLHHRLVDMGFTQKETVKILYSICGILGLVAVFMCDSMFMSGNLVKSIVIACVAIAIFIMYVFILKNPVDRLRTGLLDKNSEALQKDIYAATHDKSAEIKKRYR